MPCKICWPSSSSSGATTTAQPPSGRARCSILRATPASSSLSWSELRFARRVLEIGTSNGYSTLWLASAAQDIGGSVTTVEKSQYKIDLAAKNFARSGLASSIAQVHDDAGRLLERSADSAFDLIFLDSERPEYSGWWPHLRRVLRRGGLLVVDNATSHPAEIAPFVALVKADAEFITSLVPVGNGEFLAARSVT